MLIKPAKNKLKIPVLGLHPSAQAAQTDFPNKSAIIPRLFRTIRAIRAIRLFRLFRAFRAFRRRIVRSQLYYRQKNYEHYAKWKNRPPAKIHP
jgi:hypothetical protein